MGKVLAAFEELGKPILWGMGWVNRRLGSFGGHPFSHKLTDVNKSQQNYYRTVEKIKIGAVFVDFVDFCYFLLPTFPVGGPLDRLQSLQSRGRHQCR
jgi:hypothetical protein